MSSDRAIEARACAPKRSKTGWECANWRTGEGEWFCGHCALPLPPVDVALDPPAGTVGPGGGADDVALVFDRRDQLSYEELCDFAIVARTGAGRGGSCEVRLAEEVPADRAPASGREWLDFGTSLVSWGRQVLPLAGAKGPVDVEVSLRHRRRGGGAVPLFSGHYNYPVPEVALNGPGQIMLHPGSDELAVAVSVSPAGAMLETCSLDVVPAGLSLQGRAARDGEQLRMTFALSAEAARALERAPDAAPALLRLQFKGVGAPIETPLVLSRAAAVEIVTRSELRALSGRRARIGAQLRNGGGSAAIVERIAWRLLHSRDGEAAGGQLDYHRGTRVPPAGAVIELRPVLRDAADAAIRPGRYTLELALDYRDEHGGAETRTAAAELQITVREETVYQGVVCIDFGTTDTAAALLAPGENFFQSPSHGAVPRPIELGAISPQDRSLARLFIPTQIAVGEDETGAPTVLCAEEAVERFGTLDRGQLVDRLKWKLGRRSDDGDLADYGSVEDLIGVYLDHVRRLIEEHPDVAARVEKVVATRPARFGELRERALVRAFAKAGMTVDETRFGERSRTMVSESWPPVLLMLPVRQDTGGAGGTRLLSELKALEPKLEFPEQIEIAALHKNAHFVCIFDIGGGSTDVSLLRLSAKEGRIHVADEWTHTDDRFAGEGIRDLIVHELRTSARLALAATGKRLDADIHTLRRVAAQLQFHPHGPFNYAASTFFDFIDRLRALPPADAERLARRMADDASMLPSGEEGDEADALLAWVKQQLEQYVQPSFGYTQKAVLPLGGGRSLELAGDELHDLMIRVFFRFLAEYEPRIVQIYSELRHRLEGAGSEELRMLMTGRGSAFALNELLLSHVAGGQGIGSTRFHRAPPVSAKAVTSWGALGLYAARRVARRLEFVGLVGGYALCAQDFFTGKRIGAVPLEEVHVGETTLYGVPLHRIPPDFDPCMLTVSEDLGERQEADVYARLEEAGIDLGAERSRNPAGGILFHPETQRVSLIPDFNRPVVE